MFLSRLKMKPGKQCWRKLAKRLERALWEDAKNHRQRKTFLTW